MNEIKLIIADDHQLFRNGLEELLRKYDDIKIVESVADGVDFMEVEKSQLEADIVVLDITMPNMDGFKFIQTLLEHKLFANLPIIAITGLTKDQIETHGGLPPKVQMLSKPIDMDWLRGFFGALISVRLMRSKAKA